MVNRNEMLGTIIFCDDRYKNKNSSNSSCITTHCHVHTENLNGTHVQYTVKLHETSVYYMANCLNLSCSTRNYTHDTRKKCYLCCIIYT